MASDNTTVVQPKTSEAQNKTNEDQDKLMDGQNKTIRCYVSQGPIFNLTIFSSILKHGSSSGAF